MAAASAVAAALALVPIGGNVRALYNWKARNEREITLVKGEVLKVVEKDASGWWKGDYKGKVGIFPSNFVEALAATLDKAKAKYDYNAANERQLSFKKGDLIEVVARDPSGWWRGILRGKTGLFPSNFVEPQAPEEIGTPIETLYAMYDYAGQPGNAQYLAFKKGDKIEVMKKPEGSGWWIGRLHGVNGKFPSNFVCTLDKYTKRNRPEKLKADNVRDEVMEENAHKYDPAREDRDKREEERAHRQARINERIDRLRKEIDEANQVVVQIRGFMADLWAETESPEASAGATASTANTAPVATAAAAAAPATNAASGASRAAAATAART